MFEYQISTLNLNIPKFKWVGAEEPTIYYVYQIDGQHLNMLLKMRVSKNLPQYRISTEVNCNTTWRQMSLGTLGHQQRHMARSVLYVTVLSFIFF